MASHNDSVVYFDVDRFFTEDQSAEEFLASMKKMKRNIDAGGEWIPVPIKNPIQQREWRRTHPSAAVELAWDRDADVVYVTRMHRISEASPITQAAALRPWNLLWAWPRDGRRETLEGAGVALAKQYAAQGLDMLPEHAQFEDGGVSVEAGLMEMLARMETGRFKVFKHLNDWFEEFRLHHRKDGRVYKQGDDLMSATRYAVMSLRYARTSLPPKPRSLRLSRGGWMAA
jgi:hypothetical protein